MIYRTFNTYVELEDETVDISVECCGDSEGVYFDSEFNKPSNAYVELLEVISVVGLNNGIVYTFETLPNSVRRKIQLQAQDHLNESEIHYEDEWF